MPVNLRPSRGCSEPGTLLGTYQAMDNLEKQLVELDLDMARAKQYRRDLKATLDKGVGSDQELGALEKRLRKTKQGLKECKAKRKAIIEKLLGREVETVKAAVAKDAPAKEEAVAE